MEPARGELGIPPTISSALAMEQHAHMQQGAGGPPGHVGGPPPQQQSPITPQHDGPPLSAGPRKRKKAGGEAEEGMLVGGSGGSEPRRLRRSHEACARCRSKKIKCDSKHPRCTACETAGVQCNQEDRHRKTLTPRGHVEKIERQLLLCQALIRRQNPNFVLDELEHFCIQEGIEPDVTPDEIVDHFQLQSTNGHSSRPFPDGPPPPPHPNSKPFPYPPPPHHHILPPGYPMTIPAGYHPPPGSYPIPIPPGMYDPRIHPVLQYAPPRPDIDIKGQDPQANDMSSDQALAKNFGVDQSIVTEAKLNNVSTGPEVEDDLAVGSGGLISGRDRDVTELSPPRDPKLWTRFEMHHSNYRESRSVPVWLPKDRQRSMHIVQVYFRALNCHRPVLLKDTFCETFEKLYNNQQVPYDPGYVCSLYLVLALGTMSELNKTVSAEVNNPYDSMPRKVLPGWIEHEEFFDRALAVKPDLRMTISSLQALILLHWYLYTERQQRSLWRLVGSLVRVAIELGLHHDPFQQGQTFTENESQLRIRLWTIVMIHDRGTSILLGRPLAISPADSSTPHPSRPRRDFEEFSEHFFLSAPVAEIQADIVNALYSPTRHTSESIMRNATRIIKSMVEFRSGLPDNYKYFFSGTENWSIQQKQDLVDKMTDDQGLTLLKIGIARILLLRAIFSSEILTIQQRRKALQDAIIVSHNIIVIHHTLIKFPDIAFFVSPIPLHIAAMVILFGQMSGCDRIQRDTAIEDIWFALDMLPRFRWRWERKDMNGGHPLIERLAERVLKLSLNDMKAKCTGIGDGSSGSTPLVMVAEEDWEAGSPTLASPTTPSLLSPKHHARPGGFPGPNQPVSQAQHYALIGANANGSTDNPNSSGGNNGKAFPAISPIWFYPMDPENPGEIPQELMGPPATPQMQHQPHPSGVAVITTPQQHVPSQHLAHHVPSTTVPSHVQQPPIGVIGCQQSNAYVQEEKDPSVSSEFMIQVAMQQRMAVAGRPAADGSGPPNYAMP